MLDFLKIIPPENGVGIPKVLMPDGSIVPGVQAVEVRMAADEFVSATLEVIATAEEIDVICQYGVVRESDDG